ncbi:hypothetical protein CspHIS471_0104750 [Cutaneotrichosporon sp. HIS471]|nr:hypothetical protein CspHIS471_0104750 [Cutaneotrichosporon sp. HIS471]
MLPYLDPVQDAQRYYDMAALVSNPQLAHPNPFLQVNSDSSGASSPDTATALLNRHRGESSMPPPPRHSSRTSPVRVGASSAPPWYGLTAPYEVPAQLEWRDERVHQYMQYAAPRHHPYVQEPPAPPRKSGRLGVKRRQKYTRSRTGCLGCRARRIKCDEGRPICRRCVVAKRESDCVFPEQGEKKRKDSDSECSSPEHRKNSPDEAALDLLYRGSDESQLSLSSLSTHSGSFESQIPDELGLKPESFGALPFDLPMPEGFGLLWSAPPFLANAPLSFLEAPGQASVHPAHAPVLHTQAQAQVGRENADLTIAMPHGPNPILAVSPPLVLASLRRTSVACDALRLALLGADAAHQAFLQARGGQPTSETAGLAAASSLREEGKDMVGVAVSRGDASDATIAAATSPSTIDIFLGGAGWEPNFALAKRIVEAPGGQRALLAGPSTALSDGRAEGYAAHSVETQFGVSHVVLLFGPVAQLLPRVRSPPSNHQYPSALARVLSPDRAAARVVVRLAVRYARVGGRVSADVFQVFVGRHIHTTLRRGGIFAPDANPFRLNPNPTPDDGFTGDAVRLNLDLEQWIEDLPTATGDRADAYAMRILLTRTTRCTRGLPGLQCQHTCVGHEYRPHVARRSAWMLGLRPARGVQSCYDVDTAPRIIREVWRKVICYN